MTYKTYHQDRSIINVLARLRTICYRSDNGGLSFKPYKSVVSVKSLNNFSNAKLNDPHSFKEEIKIKYDAVLAVVGKFPNEIGPMMELLKVKQTPFRWDNYFAMPVIDQAIWKEG